MSPAAASAAPVSPAVVLQASGPNGLGIVRALGREGIPVIACDHDPRALGLLSRYATPCFTRNPLTDPTGFADDVVALGGRLAAPGVLFATHDETLIALGPHEERLAGRFHRPWSPWERMGPALDKAAQHAAARACGFPVPASVVVRDEGDLAAVAGELRFPVVVKPRRAPEFRARAHAQLLECVNIEQLRRVWDIVGPYEPQVCEMIPGGDERIWTLGSYRDAAGVPLASFTGRKLRQWPTRFGTGRAAEAHWDAEYAARGHRLLDELGFHGLSQLETKRDPRDERDYLIEVNTRSWLWIDLAVAAGVNLPLAAYLDAVGRPRTWPAGHRSDIRWLLTSKHIGGSLREIHAREWTWGEFLATLRPPWRDGVWARDDPAPARGQLARQLRALGARLGRRIRG